MLIEYKGVNIRQGEKLVLKEVDFHADEQQMIYIVGNVGEGKTSLLKTMYCELDLNRGEEAKAEVLGHDLLTIKRKEIPALRREMGIIFQDFKLLHDRTVYKNLEFVLRSTGWKNSKEIDERIESVLDEVGLADKKDKRPHELSGGEQQRIAIARAILNCPKLIIADEPTGNLDWQTAEKIVGYLKNITQKGATVVMSTHNMHIIETFPGIVYKCADGKLQNVTKEFEKK